MTHTQLPKFGGVDIKNDSTDEALTNFRRADNAILFPRGGFSRPWPTFRLWGLPNLGTYAAALGVSSADGTCSVLIRNEGVMVIVFYDFSNNQALGFRYAGHDPESNFSGVPTLTASGATVELLQKGLATETRWNGTRAANRMFLCNGIDPNLVFEEQLLTIRPMNDGIRPLAPAVSAIDPVDVRSSDSILQAGNVLFTGLESDFLPIQTSEPPFVRARGNYVAVSVQQLLGGAVNFSSEVTGVGTPINPFVYTVFTPTVLPTEQELINFIARDTNSQGLLSASLIGDSSIVILFPSALLSGATTTFASTDVFSGPVLAVALTYAKLNPDDLLITETMPGPVVTAQPFENGRVTVTIDFDTVSPEASDYQTIRIYAADLSDGKKTFAPDDYGNFLFCLEVPNMAGTWTIAPSMMGTKSLNIEARTPPPCSQVVFANNQLILSGNDEHPMRVWFTKQPVAGERLPEGIGLYTWQDFQSQTPGDRVTAIASYRGDSMVYTKTRAYALFDSSKKYTLIAGALNSQCIATWTSGVQYFVGADLRIYSLAQPTFSGDSAVPNTDFAAPQIADYLGRFCDPLDDQVAHSIIDPINKHWWLFLRGTVGNVQSFVYDFDGGQVTGPIDFPQFFDCDRIDEDSRIIGVDLAGNLFVMDTTNTLSITEVYSNTSPLTPLPAITPFDPAVSDGGSFVALPDNTFIRDGQVIRMQTVFTNLGRPDRDKSFLDWRCSLVRGSAGLLELWAMNETGIPVYRNFGEVYGYENLHLGFMLPGKLIQILLVIVVGEGKPFSVRDMTVGWSMRGTN